MEYVRQIFAQEAQEIMAALLQALSTVEREHGAVERAAALRRVTALTHKLRGAASSVAMNTIARHTSVIDGEVAGFEKRDDLHAAMKGLRAAIEALGSMLPPQSTP